MLGHGEGGGGRSQRRYILSQPKEEEQIFLQECLRVWRGVEEVGGEGWRHKSCW